MKSQPKSSNADRPGMLSALLDGEATRDEADAACAAWRDDAGVRDRWHAYALIGDVLRSEDLGHAAARDAAFMRMLGERLAAEPTPLNRAPLRRMWRQFAVPAAVAAGFAAVAGVTIVLRGPNQPDAVSIAANSGDGVALSTPHAARARGVDRYVAAHRVQSIRRASLASAATDHGR